MDFGGAPLPEEGSLDSLHLDSQDRKAHLVQGVQHSDQLGLILEPTGEGCLRGTVGPGAAADTKSTETIRELLGDSTLDDDLVDRRVRERQ